MGRPNSSGKKAARNCSWMIGRRRSNDDCSSTEMVCLLLKDSQASRAHYSCDIAIPPAAPFGGVPRRRAVEEEGHRPRPRRPAMLQ